MCLVTKKIRPLPKYTVGQLLAWEEQVAPKNISCWKRFEKSGKDLVTAYKYFRWPDPGKVVTVPAFGATLRAGCSDILLIEEGLHAYTSKRMAHSKIPSYYRTSQVVKRMIIPKGTKFIHSEYGEEIVALSMMMAPTKTTTKKDGGRKRISAKTSKRKVVKRKGKG